MNVGKWRSVAGMSNLWVKGIVTNIIGVATIMACLFLPVGTLDYWQAWVFLAVLLSCSLVLGLYPLLYDRELLRRRLQMGPSAEKETSQKIIVTLLMLSVFALPVFASFDHRFGWSIVPPYVSILGDALLVLSYVIFVIVLKENTYSASNIQVEECQTVISTGLYAHVRHPMYAGALVMMVSIPLSLGSWWGLFLVPLAIPVLLWRLLDEEKFLHKYLAGYTSYTQNVRYRLVPHVW
jgi:protein-S-isoprenylcysteine O-methyltransferase Ste14